MKQSGFGIVSLICGILSILLACLSVGIVPAVIGIILAIVAFIQKNRGHGTAIAGLVCSVVGAVIFLVALALVNGDGESSITSSEYNAESETKENGTDAQEIDLAKQMSVEEYSYENTIADTLYFLIVKNNSEETVEINVNAIAKDSDGNTIGATDSSERAVASGQEVCLCNYFDSVKDADSFEYTMSVKKDVLYESAMDDISVEESKTDKKVILTCTNNGENPVEFVEAYALFFKDGKLVNYDSNYIDDNDSEIKPGSTISGELCCDSGYDDVKIFVSGRK